MTNYLNKLNKLAKEINIEDINKQVDEINQIIYKIDHNQIIKKAPKKLGFEPDILEYFNRSYSKQDQINIKVIDKMLNSFRQYLSLQYGLWSLPNLETASLIKDELQINSVLEIMAGNALWSKAFNEVGLNVIATDNLEWAKTSNTGKKQFLRVENLDANKAIQKYNKVDAVFCSWAPNFGNYDLQVVQNWSTTDISHLLFCGEKDGATNTKIFWSNVNLKHTKELKRINQSFQSFDFIAEKIFEIGRHEQKTN